MNVLVTGAGGFIGRNLTAHLGAREGFVVTGFGVHDSPDDLRAGLKTADIVYHLAGVNRPETVEEFEIGNTESTRMVCEILRELGRTPVVVMSSSVQAALENPYGVSKLRAEEALSEFAAETGAQVRIYRLKNVFGKWARPNYNSAVATFCHNIANGLPIQICDPNRELELVYVDDVVEAFLAELPGQTVRRTGHIPCFHLTLGDLAGRIQSFHQMRANLLIPDLALRCNQQLYATYLAYLPDDAPQQQLLVKQDQRGALAEFIKSKNFGQIFVSRSRAGVTRGNHYHHSKSEKFFVVEGEAVIRMRQIESSEVLEYRVRGEEFQVIDIPPGYTHSIENVGAGEMVAIFWASDIFDPDYPDTYSLPVGASAEIPDMVTT
jgi:UDP-2-acetamido-2,6-beta-L-arabino-hexul-4-ose reductase